MSKPLTLLNLVMAALCFLNSKLQGQACLAEELRRQKKEERKKRKEGRKKEKTLPSVGDDAEQLGFPGIAGGKA